MLLGQLYYFEKKLDAVPALIASGGVAQIELAGLEFDDIKILEKYEPKDIHTKLLVLFTQKYTQLLSENGLTDALETWKLITNPFKEESHSHNRFPLYERVDQWLNSDSEEISDVISDTGIANEENSFAILYGLQVLNILSNKQPKNKQNAQTLNENHKHISPDLVPKIIVVCNPVLSPLFTNLNCVFIDSGLKNQDILGSIQDMVDQEPTISLILIDSPHREELSKLIVKKIGNTVLVAPLDLNISESEGYFDNLVKKTLGVRLV
jgi:hypothetical protein